MKPYHMLDLITICSEYLNIYTFILSIGVTIPRNYIPGNDDCLRAMLPGSLEALSFSSRK